MGEGDWSSLPGLLLEAIANQLGEIEDLLALRSVCVWWRRSVAKERWRPCVPRLPWLMLADNKDKGTSGFYSVERGKRYDLKKLPPARRRWGSVNGWVFNVGLNLETFLVNPLTGVEIPLPPLTTLEELPGYEEPLRTSWHYSYVHKAIVLEIPKPTPHTDDDAHGRQGCGGEVDIVVMVTYGMYGLVGVAKPGFKSWALIEHEGFTSGCLCLCWDLTCYQGQVFAVGWYGSLHLCDVAGTHPPKATKLADETKFVRVQGREQLYLVESGTDLLMVMRIHSGLPKLGFITKSFRVFKFNLKTKKWNRVRKHLGDRRIVVSRSYSISVQSKATKLDCKVNSIYYDDSNDMSWYEIEGGGGHDMGIFDFKAKTFESVYTGEDSCSHVSPPTWVMMPNFR